MTPTLAQLRALAADRRECGDSAGVAIVTAALEWTPTGTVPTACTWCGAAFAPLGRRGGAQRNPMALLPKDGEPCRCVDCSSDPDVPVLGREAALEAAAALLAAYPLIGSRWYSSANSVGASADEWRAIAADLFARAGGNNAAGLADRARDAISRAEQFERKERAK